LMTQDTVKDLEFSDDINKLKEMLEQWLRSALQAKFWHKVEIFKKNPFDERLRTHKLSGKLKELWSLNIEYDVRVIFYFVEQDKAIFIDIGNHDDVY
jgi:addiction module RelE/StbE family toxin